MESSEHLKPVFVETFVDVGHLEAELAAVQPVAFERKLHFESLIFSRNHLELGRELEKTRMPFPFTFTAKHSARYLLVLPQAVLLGKLLRLSLCKETVQCHITKSIGREKKPDLNQRPLDNEVFTLPLNYNRWPHAAALTSYSQICGIIYRRHLKKVKNKKVTSDGA